MDTHSRTDPVVCLHSSHGWQRKNTPVRLQLTKHRTINYRPRNLRLTKTPIKSWRAREGKGGTAETTALGPHGKGSTARHRIPSQVRIDSSVSHAADPELACVSSRGHLLVVVDVTLASCARTGPECCVH